MPVSVYLYPIFPSNSAYTDDSWNGRTAAKISMMGLASRLGIQVLPVCSMVTKWGAGLQVSGLSLFRIEGAN
jgi:hypothetical protein